MAYLQDSIPDSHMTRYDRQILIENWDQAKIRNSCVVIVGLGALGTIAAASLAMAGVGHLILVDYDTIEFSNLNRQLLFHIEDVGKSKVAVAERELKIINPDLNVSAFDMKIQDVPLGTKLIDYEDGFYIYKTPSGTTFKIKRKG